MKKTKVFFRADGNSKIGLGHVIRSLALADMLRDDFECHFIIRNPLDTLRTQILEVCETIISLPDTTDDSQEANYIAQTYLTGNEIIVLDGYHFITEYQKVIKSTGCKLVCIDDIHAYHFVADVVINHAGGITKKFYSYEPYTQFCLGLPYALLRKPFIEAAKNKDYNAGKKHNLFICLGGADPNNDTLQVLKKSKDLRKLEMIYIIVGSAYNYKKELKEYITSSNQNVKIFQNLSATELVACMQACGKAITSPSTIAYEYLSVGGELYLQLIADNQNKVYQFLTKKKLALDVELLYDSEKVAELNIENNIFDGQQHKRFKRIFQSLTLRARIATLDDLMLYFNWANDPIVRQQSYNSEPIPLEQHKRWFLNKIASNNTKLFVIELDNIPIGQIRFEVKDQTVIINYSLDEKFRGRGLGEGILRIGISNYLKNTNQDLNIVGYVKKDNIPSVKAFRAITKVEKKIKTLQDSYQFIIT